MNTKMHVLGPKTPFLLKGQKLSKLAKIGRPNFVIVISSRRGRGGGGWRGGGGGGALRDGGQHPKTMYIPPCRVLTGRCLSVGR